MAIPPLSLTAASNPYANSGTGSDIHDKQNNFDFGGISVGGAGSTWVSGLIRDAIVAGIAGLAVKYLWSKIK